MYMFILILYIYIIHVVGSIPETCSAPVVAQMEATEGKTKKKKPSKADKQRVLACVHDTC